MARSSLKPDPPVARDGRCARRGCKKPRRKPEKATQIPRLAEMLARDPFCSTECAKAFHGTAGTEPSP